LDAIGSAARGRTLPKKVVSEKCMGVRITLFALDLPQFASFIERSTWECKSPWELEELLITLSKRPSDPIANLLTSGNRRWWIGSFLEYAETILGSNAPDYVFLASFFHTILQGYDCGKRLPKNLGCLPPVAFPFHLKEEPDLRMSVISGEDTARCSAIIRSIMYDNTRFARPSSPIGVAPEEDEDWDAWVRQMLGQLLAAETVAFRNAGLVGFIG
jgi:hypothetical protein